MTTAVTVPYPMYLGCCYLYDSHAAARKKTSLVFIRANASDKKWTIVKQHRFDDSRASAFWRFALHFARPRLDDIYFNSIGDLWCRPNNHLGGDSLPT